MTVSPAFWPGLALAALLLARWVGESAWPWYRQRCWIEQCAYKDICPDCQMANSHCTCVVFEPWDDE